MRIVRMSDVVLPVVGHNRSLILQRCQDDTHENCKMRLQHQDKNKDLMVDGTYRASYTSHIAGSALRNWCFMQ